MLTYSPSPSCRTIQGATIFAKILPSDNEIWEIGGSEEERRGYNKHTGTVRVDTLHKLVIIAVGGKIGNPLRSACSSDIRNWSGLKNPTHVEHRCRNSGALVAVLLQDGAEVNQG